ncbi:uncharacterized protein LOC132256982 [Phlebotomus argentipes]|uniref:uncharacterized protein LOC132256982 n=1 Tax=Phlebotomus argentipes TaxID=94469 RepID=UPI0028931625|nr:uncharacterized protein LOC132256982 [Phlebotomus argentipes]XP_059609618.1 uncharacterized protein LOC132256982 [Phlebotomus argentipes]
MLLPDQTYEQVLSGQEIVASIGHLKKLLELESSEVAKKILLIDVKRPIEESSKGDCHGEDRHEPHRSMDNGGEAIESECAISRRSIELSATSSSDQTRNDDTEDDYDESGECDDDLLQGEEKIKTTENHSRSNSPKDFERTTNFFNNIPEFCGQPLRPFTRPENSSKEPHQTNSVHTNLDILRACEMFLYKHRIRPDFFCRYKKAMDASLSAPPSWRLSRCRSPRQELARKPQSNSPPEQRSYSRMHRFQKATAIYTLPLRGRGSRRSVQSSTGE